LFPTKWGRFIPDYYSADTPLWFFWTVQNLFDDLGGAVTVWKDYKKPMTTILEAYREGTDFNIHLQGNGLISASSKNLALTWMNAYSAGVPVTPRYGNPVEINALWYNALCFSLELAKESNDLKFIEEWTDIADRCKAAFIDTFWNEKKGYLADCYYEGVHDWSVRPNQVIAVALKNSPLNKEMMKAV
jgi:predicted glycogen debranching enzyme